MSTSYLTKLVQAIREANHRRIWKRREPQRNAYGIWAAAHDSMTPEKRTAFQKTYQQVQRRPLISVIMPVYNAPLTWLDQAIESVRRQIYQEWEICISDDCSSHADIRPYLESKARQDARIKVDFRTVNGHISAASNSAIALASGEFLALMDQDDLIPEHALLEVAICINENPDVAVIYSDEDKIDRELRRAAPIQKKTWTLDCLSKFNSISHLGVYKADLVRKIGGFRVGYEGSQDHDLALRCVEQLRPDQVIHIDKVLYHWRIHDNSTAHSETVKPYAVTAREKAIREHFERTGRNSVDT